MDNSGYNVGLSGFIGVVAWMKLPPQARVFEYLVPSSWNCWGSIRRCGLVGTGMPLRLIFEVSKLTTFPVSSHCLVPLEEEITSQLFCCHAAMPPF